MASIRKHKGTTEIDHALDIVPDLLDRDTFVDGPNLKMSCDISRIWASEGWLYLAAILDLYPLRVIGRSGSDRMKRDLAIRASKKIVALTLPPTR